jgi:hypothetical protein
VRVTDEYDTNARFTGTVVRIDFDQRPDFHPDHDSHGPRHDAHTAQAMIRQ